MCPVMFQIMQPLPGQLHSMGMYERNWSGPVGLPWGGLRKAAGLCPCCGFINPSVRALLGLQERGQAVFQGATSSRCSAGRCRRQDGSPRASPSRLPKLAGAKAAATACRTSSQASGARGTQRRGLWSHSRPSRCGGASQAAALWRGDLALPLPTGPWGEAKVVHERSCHRSE